MTSDPAEEFVFLPATIAMSCKGVKQASRQIIMATWMMLPQLMIGLPYSRKTLAHAIDFPCAVFRHPSSGCLKNISSTDCSEQDGLFAPGSVRIMHVVTICNETNVHYNIDSGNASMSQFVQTIQEILRGKH